MSVQGFFQRFFNVVRFASLVGLAIATPASAAPNVERVADFLVGAMQTEIPPRSPDDGSLFVRMTTCRIDFNLAGSDIPAPAIALYQEQAVTTNLTQPYRQRLLLLSTVGSGETVESYNFRLADEMRWAGLCSRDRVQRTISAGDLGEAVCGLRLEPEGEGFLGNTPDGGCPSDYRGASFTTNTIWLTEATMETWDRGFDADGNQVWGAEDESYLFFDIDLADER
ncbi:MAG: chromophore lyase CpcT/CpeT [Geitlerinemataceae cyanobacterium]